MEEGKKISSFVVKKYKINPKCLHLILKSTIYIICFYQLIQLVLDYTKYDMINEYRTQPFIEDTSITFCAAKENLFTIKSEINLIYSMHEDLFSFDSRRIYIDGKYCSFYKMKYNDTIISEFHTLESIEKKFILSFQNYPFTLNLILNGNNSTPHFGKLFILKPKQDNTNYNLQPVYSIRKLLPRPFQHDCYDYESSTSEFISREHCYMDYMRKLELKYCKVNKYWTLNNQKEDNVTKCIKPNFTILNTVCKINCLDVKRNYAIVKNHNNLNRSSTEGNHIWISTNDLNAPSLYLEFSPKFTKMHLFSKLGGLFGMWLGLSIKSVIIILFDKIYYLGLKLSQNFSILRETKIPLLLNLIIILLMTLNLKELINEYLSGHEITKIDIVNNVNFPSFGITENFVIQNNECATYFENLQKNYSHIAKIVNQNYPEFQNIDKDIRDIRTQLFLKELIFEYGYEYYYKTIFPHLRGITECEIIDKFGNFTSCKNIIKIILQNDEYELYRIHCVILSSLENKINLNFISKIIIKLNFENCFSKKLLDLENDIDRYLFSFTGTANIDIKLQKILIRKSSLKENCISIQTNKSYNIYKCMLEYINNILVNKFKFDCMPRDRITFNLDHWKIFGSKFCNREKLLSSSISRNDIKQAFANCSQPCETEFNTFEILQKPYPDQIRINLIPKSNWKPILTYSFSMNYNDFIYDIGGTIGMWMGFSALSIPLYFYELYRKLTYQIIRVYLINILNIIFSKLKFLLLKLIYFPKFLLISLKKILIIMHYPIVMCFKGVYHKLNPRKKLFQNRLIPLN